ncbi:MAG TPA: ferrochelatase [Candidatus Binataceae bacterium]|nr:ferrochelatase [Candidatus Binataceae bacterium]
MSAGCDAVLMIGFGGPTALEEVRPFLANVVGGRSIPTARLEEVVGHYAAIGGASPYNAHTQQQAQALKAALGEIGIDLPVYVGMRNWEPYLREAVAALADRGARRVVGVVLAAHRCEASWERYLQATAQALSELGGRAPAIEYLPPWHDHPLFIQAVAGRTRAAWERLDKTRRLETELIFTAHSIPVAMAARSRYTQELAHSARLVAQELGIERWRLAYQSRSGAAHEAWLEPDLEHVLADLRGASAVLVPIGFLCDHVEVVYDLDIEAQALARKLDVRMERAGTVGDHPLFIRMLASLIADHMME